MKKLIIVIIIFAGCSKKEDQPQTTIQVLESITNLPLSGANVSLRKLAGDSFDGVTDDNGICLVPSLLYHDRLSSMRVDKENYWYLVGKNRPVHLIPFGWLQLRIRKVGNYNAGARLFLTHFDQSGEVYHVTDVNAAADSLVVAFCYGNQHTRIQWNAFDGAGNRGEGTIDWLQIPRLDTLKNVTLDY